MLELVRPTASFKSSYLDALAEFHTERRFLYHRVHVLERNFEAHIRAERALIHWENIAIFRVPETIFWLVDDDTYIGRLELRHHLKDHVDDIGGHIGYSIRPDQRQQGFGHAILSLGLQKAAQRALSRVLLTCDPENIASRKIIEKNGGIFERRIERVIGEVHYCKLRYWIEVPITHQTHAPAERKTGHHPRI